MDIEIINKITVKCTNKNEFLHEDNFLNGCNR